MEELIILPHPRTYMKLFDMPSGICAHCGLEGIPATVFTTSGGPRKIIFEDGRECHSFTDEWTFRTPPDGTWHMERHVKDEQINIFERGVQLPTHEQWVDVPGSPFQVRTISTDELGAIWVRANPEIWIGPLMIPDDVRGREGEAISSAL